jgi:ABC-type thiamine transport system substrate-binding protein
MNRHVRISSGSNEENRLARHRRTDTADVLLGIDIGTLTKTR